MNDDRSTLIKGAAFSWVCSSAEFSVRSCSDPPH